MGILFALAVLVGCRSILFSSTSTETYLPKSSPTFNFNSTDQITSTVPFLSISSPTATEIPMLSVTAANSKVQEYLQNGLICPLPCWMGIVPGQSTWHELKNQQTMLSNIATDKINQLQGGNWLYGEFDIRFTKSTATIDILSIFMGPAGGENITFFGFDTKSYKPYDDPDRDLYGYGPYNDMLRAYSLQAILSNLGKPAIIHVLASLRHDLPVTPGFGDYFQLHVVYPQKGILMEYQMKPEDDGNNYRICPASAWISGGLTAPDLGPGYGKFLATVDTNLTYLASPLQQAGNTEEAFGMTIEEFYQAFLSAPDRCLETPKSLWWHK